MASPPPPKNSNTGDQAPPALLLSGTHPLRDELYEQRDNFKNKLKEYKNASGEEVAEARKSLWKSGRAYHTAVLNIAPLVRKHTIPEYDSFNGEQQQQLHKIAVHWDDYRNGTVVDKQKHLKELHEMAVALGDLFPDFRSQKRQRESKKKWIPKNRINLDLAHPDYKLIELPEVDMSKVFEGIEPPEIDESVFTSTKMRYLEGGKELWLTLDEVRQHREAEMRKRQDTLQVANLGHTAEQTSTVFSKIKDPATSSRLLNDSVVGFGMNNEKGSEEGSEDDDDDDEEEEDDEEDNEEDNEVMMEDDHDEQDGEGKGKGKTDDEDDEEDIEVNLEDDAMDG